MSLLFRTRSVDASTSGQLPARSTSAGSVSVSASSAMRASAVWACLRLRADLISTLPLDVYRYVDGYQVDSPVSPFLRDPAADGFGLPDWLYTSQVELDRTGNAVGPIKAVDALGKPAVVEIVPTDQVTVKGNGPTITGYRFGSSGREYAPSEVWHERQFTVPGIPLGLSPVTYGAFAVGGYLSAQQFGLDWFANGSIPAGRLKNTRKTLSPGEAAVVKDRFRAAVASRDLFVHGADWEYDAVQITANESQFLETMKAGVTDIARFFGVPGDLIDASPGGSSITYANITQRNLQLLVMNLGPAIVRRERALSAALAAPRFVKLNTDALLRMDPQTRAAVLNGQVAARTLAPSEARALDNRLPFTAEQLAEFDQLFGAKASQPMASLPVQKSERAAGVVEVHTAPPQVRVENHLPAPSPTPVHIDPAAVRVENHVPPTAAPEVRVDVQVPEGPAPVIVNQIEVEPADVVLNGPAATTVRYALDGSIRGTDYHYPEGEGS